MHSLSLTALSSIKENVGKPSITGSWTCKFMQICMTNLAMKAAALAFPVLSVDNRCPHAMRKKLNHIDRMEESLAREKSLKKEQEALFNSNPSILAGIKVLKNLRPLLSSLLVGNLNF
ncbi:uncharacterized protein LOC127241188 [Andrographis paniculata]|uniref:uncharacterized protein LOC127241188 n=1 Tax=Andrographis paniculata TaxID=175694 RepID=UPI0021E8363B|nr:uncharacterized protein LOC127241188 [Andrographis paniculata]XP_051116070.1 uncharacterized protein LOC127241188 [Andrographis paniculata]XP_051116071.1 uncharacterized protein LOC127241188 [Andrographis paniculata]